MGVSAGDRNRRELKLVTGLFTEAGKASTGKQKLD